MHTVVGPFFDNAVMVISTPVTITLLACKTPSIRRWGGITGMFGQIFWITSNCQWDRWGMFAVSVFCDLVYMNVVLRQWLAPYLLSRYAAVGRQSGACFRLVSWLSRA